MPVAAFAFGRGAAKTIYQPCGRRNEHAAQRANTDRLVVVCAAWCRLLLWGALPIVAAAIGVGARYPGKPLM
jgi:hypothetical protein